MCSFSTFEQTGQFFDLSDIDKRKGQEVQKSARWKNQKHCMILA